MKKKFLALVMTLSMVLSLVPMTALAAENGQVEKEATVAAENQAASEGAGNQDSSSITGGDKNTTGGEDSTNTPDTNTNNGNKGSESENAGGTESGSTSSGGGTEGGSTTETTESETPVEPEAPKNAAKIGNTKYETLDAAIAVAGATDVIELLNDCELTVGEIKTPITIQGNGKTVTVPEQEKRTNHEHPGNLGLESSLTFKNTKVFFENTKAWSLIMTGGAVLTLDEKSVCTFENWGVYAYENTVINVQGESKLECNETSYTSMMAQIYAYINVTGGSNLYIHDADANGVKPSANGLSGFRINVENSNITVTNCENQGLVRCPLTLDNSKAKISGNDIGITGYNETDVLTMKNSSTLTMENNKNAGIFIWGGKVDIQNGNTLTITGTGSSNTGAVTPDYYNGAVAVYAKTGNTANVSFADGATVILKNNGLSAINNLSTTSSSFYVGSGTEITCNGDTTNYGGGIYNFGSITIADGAKVYNNHAAIAGDDIYNSSIRAYLKSQVLPLF